MSKPLENKTALVTGASRGIGAAIARRLASDGAHVLLHYGASAEKAAQVQENIRAEGGQADLVQGDLASVDGVDSLVTAVRDQLAGRSLDVLVNNAGVAEYVAFEDTDAAVIDRQHAVNVRAPFLLTKGLTDKLADDASVIFVSSVVSKFAFPGVPAYSITKGAVDTLVRHLAAHLGPRGIRVNGVAPGGTATDMANWTDTEEGRAMMLSLQALQRVAQPEDIARVVAFLSGKDSGWVTGQVIDASGGIRL